MLLMGLDTTTAAELLRAVPPEVVPRIAAELAYLDSLGETKVATSDDPVREFLALLTGQADRSDGSQFMKEVLLAAVGQDGANEVLSQAQDILDRKDPFLQIRNAEVETIAEAIQGESAQVASMVLSELPEARSSKLLGLLEDEVRGDAIRGMTVAADAPQEIRIKVARRVRARLAELAGAPAKGNREKKLRKVAILLRGLTGDARDAMVKNIAADDPDVASQVKRLMVVWEDIPAVADECIQEVLRGVDSRKLALALWGATDQFIEKMRSNMSERACSMLDEESSLLSAPKTQDILQAQEDVLNALRELNEKGELDFVQEAK